MPFELLPFWPKDEVESRDDGFLIVKNGWEKQNQPLLLHSTDVLLGNLYPSIARNARFEQLGRIDETAESKIKIGSGDDSRDNDQEEEISPSSAKNSKSKNKREKIPAEYLVYQDLVRKNSLANSIQSALLDISHCRHRIRKVGNEPVFFLSKAERKIRTLEDHQQRLLSQQSETTEDGSDEENMAEHDDDEEAIQREPKFVRLLRTTNSIRALYPYLLCILNHPRRNDKKLQIRDTVWQQKRRAMCWVLGEKHFDITTSKFCKSIHRDAEIILKGYIDPSSAAEIFQKSDGSPEFWNTQWIQQLGEKSSPRILNPVAILADHYDANSIENVAQRLDKDLLSKNMDKNPPQKQMKYDDTINQLHQRILKLLKNRFPGARLSIYGSCLSNLSLGIGADVDLSLWIPEAERVKTGFQEGSISARTYEQSMKKFVYQAFHILKNRDREFTNMQPITRARVPVVKGTFLLAGNPYSPDGSINFDICFLNDIAVANSRLLQNYSIVDPRVRSLMMTVKQWTKDMKINSAKDNTISSYAWINLCIFYLQFINFIPNLQSRQLMEELEVSPNPRGNYWHSVNKLDTFSLTWNEVQKANAWEQPEEHNSTPVSALLYGFFEFYSKRFPLALFAVSIKQGNISVPKFAFRKVSLFLSIEDPFETYDSHCPHDLGTPASDGGLRDIMRFLEEGESHLREILVESKKSDGRLWPGGALFVKPNASTRKTSTRKNSQRRGGQAKVASGPPPSHKVSGNQKNTNDTATIQQANAPKATKPNSRNRRHRRNKQ